MNKENFRSEVLSSFGAGKSEIEELLFYNTNVFDHSNINLPVKLPLTDEPFVAAWRQYADKAENIGAFESLKQRLVQLSFPVIEGISRTEYYGAVTRKGVPVGDTKEATGLRLNNPNKLQLIIHQSPGGSIPLLITDDRKDFVLLSQALSMKNEPVPVPESVGACMVTGLNNWDRIKQYRKQWEERNPFENWSNEFKCLVSQKELYQDRFIILSAGPYSNVSAKDVGLSEEEWMRKSLIIRREHECAHYFTRRMFSSMRNNIIDELIADYAGIVAACGRYRSDWFLRFLGLENYPDYRKEGRLQNYLNMPRKTGGEKLPSAEGQSTASQEKAQLSDGSFGILKLLIKHAVGNLERFDVNYAEELRGMNNLSLMIMLLTHLTLEELASDEASTILRDTLDKLK